MSDIVIIGARWCLTEDGQRVVPETDIEARWLHWKPGDVVSRKEAERLGAIEMAPDPDPENPPVRRKPGRPPGSKNRTPAENK